MKTIQRAVVVTLVLGVLGVLSLLYHHHPLHLPLAASPSPWPHDGADHSRFHLLRDRNTGEDIAQPSKHTDADFNNAVELEPESDANDTDINVKYPQIMNSISLARANNPVIQRRLIILAYMRTGSSMTGSLFNSHPDVFYWFEPLHSLGQLHGQKYKEVNKWVRRHQFSSSEEAAGNLTALLTCDLGHAFPASLLHGFMSHGAATAPFKHCFINGSRDRVLRRSSALWDACLANLTDACLQRHTVIAAKTIRLRMSRAVEMMEKDPGLKVLHLVRDPRGVLESRHRLGYLKFTELEAGASFLCQEILEDLNISLSMKEKDLKDRYMLARYEDIARSPILATKLLHHFMALEPSDSVLSLAQRLSRTAPGKRKLCATCAAEASNSTARSQEWRQVAEVRNVRVINDYCSHVMAKLGYRVSFASDLQLRDLRVSAVQEPRLSVATSFIHNVPDHRLP